MEIDHFSYTSDDEPLLQIYTHGSIWVKNEFKKLWVSWLAPTYTFTVFIGKSDSLNVNNNNET